MVRARPVGENAILAPESRLDGWVGRRWPAWVVLATAILLHAAMFLLWPRAAPVGVDLNIYRAGADAVAHGLPLYDGPVTYRNLFTYPPFAALLFLPMVPLSVLPIVPLVALAILLQLGLLVLTVRRCLRQLGHHDDGSLLHVSVLLAGLLLWLEPVWLTVALGQINIALMLLILWDSTRSDSRWKGAGIGLAIGIKLTPLIFVGYLLLTRRYRMAAIALTTFAGTVAAGFLILPADAMKYWTGTFVSAGRIGDPAIPSNQSLAGMFTRFAGAGSPSILPWLIAAGLVGSTGLVLAAWAHRRGETVLGVTLVGLTAAGVSPFSWDHHWVWFAPLLVFLLHATLQQHSRTGWVLILTTYLLAFCWFADPTAFGSLREPGKGLFQLDTWAWIEPVSRNIFVWMLLATLLLTALHLRRLDQTTPLAPGVTNTAAGA